MSRLQLKTVTSTATGIISHFYCFNLVYKQVASINSQNYKLKAVKWSQFGKSKEYNNKW